MGHEYSASKSSKFQGLSLPETEAKHLTPDQFIAKHTQNNEINDASLSIDSFDVRRLVFVSVRGLYQSWKKVPSIQLYTALFVMQLKQKWIQQPSKYINELHEQIGHHCGDNTAEMRQFVDLLRWKHSQSLVFWMLDEAENDDHPCRTDVGCTANPLINPFWYRLNDKLRSLYDHVLGTKYDPIQFDETYWRNESLFRCKYSTDVRSILAEFYFVTMKHHTVQEIIYQSNPKTLQPVIEYHDKSLMFKLSPISEAETTESENDFSMLMMTPSTEYELDIDALVNEAMKKQ